MAVRIITDSASDFDLAVAKRRGIDVVPMTIQFGSATFITGKNTSDLESDVFSSDLRDISSIIVEMHI